LSNGTVYGFTDHDQDLLVENVLCKASSGFRGGASESRAGFSTDTGFIQGILTDDRITAADISAGHFAGAILKNYRVNWQNSSDFILMATGRAGKITSQGNSFNIEWIGLSAMLERSTGRVFSKFCDAQLGDMRCGINLDDFPAGTICPRTFDACVNQFSNSVNFRGFPYIIGDDALQSGPQEGEIYDGGSRYT